MRRVTPKKPSKNGKRNSSTNVGGKQRTPAAAAAGPTLDIPLPVRRVVPGRLGDKSRTTHQSLIPSAQRPHVAARDRLRLWQPLNSRNILDEQGVPTNLTPADLERISDVLEHAWAGSTRETYGTGLLIYHVFCDKKGITEPFRAPATALLITSFISTLAGAYSGSAITNYVAGVRAWHILHGLTWRMNATEQSLAIKAAERLAPATSSRKRRVPFTLEYIAALRQHLDITKPLHAAVYACLTTTFFAAARLGEFTIPSLRTFDPAAHVKPSDIRVEYDRNNLKSTIFHLPRTKSAPIHGEDVSWSVQPGTTDPEAALENHLKVNKPPLAGALFAYRYQGKSRSLTKPKFLEVIKKAAKDAGLEQREGHGIRIGSTLEYLLRGVPFEVMKVKGRWASDAFLLYLTKHAQILAPYMQAEPERHAAFMALTMPPIR